MWKRYSVDRLPLFESDDNSIRGLEPEKDFTDEITDLFDEELGGVDKPEEDDEPEGDKPEGEESGDKPEPDVDGEEGGEVEIEKKPEGGEPVDDPAPETPKPTSEVEELKAQIAALISTVNSLKTPAKEPEPEKKLELPPVDLITLFKDVDFDTVMETKEGFLEFLSKAMATVQSTTVDSVISSIPGLVDGVVTRKTTLDTVVKDFYGTYPELEGAKKYVSFVANGISEAEPNLSMQEVLTKAAAKAKADLGLKELPKKEETPAADGKKKPSLPGGSGGSRGKAPKPNKLQSEIDDLLDY